MKRPKRKAAVMQGTVRQEIISGEKWNYVRYRNHHGGWSSFHLDSAKFPPGSKVIFTVELLLRKGAK